MKQTASIIFRSASLILIGVMLGIFISRDNYSGSPFAFGGKRNDKMSKVLQLVQYNYVDSVDVDSIEGATVNEFLQKLDPHSLYLPPQQATEVNQQLEGGFEGLGIEYALLRDTFVVTQVFADGPAAKAGMVGGTKILQVNNKKFSGTGLTDESIAGTLAIKGSTPVQLSILTPGAAKPSPLTVKPGRVPLSSVDAWYMTDAETGYIKISKFASTTGADFRKAITMLKVQGLKKLVLDLRGNGGGYLTAATELADEFLTKDKLIVYTKGVHEPRTDYFATDSGSFQTGKLAVIIDEYSASASEILAGALQDLDRAVIVGRRSFGKGLVQQQFPFEDGSAVNLTVARYYTPSGRSIQKSYSHGAEQYRNELAERMRKGELFSAENNYADSAFRKKAVYHTSGGKDVYSGGGIMPDIFVAADSTENNLLVNHLNSLQVFTAYVIDRMQPVLKGYDRQETFINGFEVSDTQFADFILYAAQTFKLDSLPGAEPSKDMVKKLIKAHAARFKWGSSAYYRTLNTTDTAINKAAAGI